jgi:GMP synthase (glutamine-hydrolysing)
VSRPLIVKTGGARPELALEGDFEGWIAVGMGLAPAAVDVVAVDAGEALPPPGAPSGIVVTGSSALVSEREPWSERTAEWLARAVEADVPILGICYGHQLLAHALGGAVGANPRGREIGTVQVRVLAAGRTDPLLGTLGDEAPAHATHVESVLALPPGAVRLAESDLDPVQAARFGARAWGVQFHPEFDVDAIRAYLASRSEAKRAEGLDPEQGLARVRETPAGPRLLRRFAELLAR